MNFKKSKFKFLSLALLSLLALPLSASASTKGKGTFNNTFDPSYFSKFKFNDGTLSLDELKFSIKAACFNNNIDKLYYTFGKTDEKSTSITFLRKVNDIGFKDDYKDLLRIDFFNEATKQNGATGEYIQQSHFHLFTDGGREVDLNGYKQEKCSPLVHINLSMTQQKHMQKSNSLNDLAKDLTETLGAKKLEIKKFNSAPVLDIGNLFDDETDV